MGLREAIRERGGHHWAPHLAARCRRRAGGSWISPGIETMQIRTQALVEGGAAGKVCDPGLQKGSEETSHSAGTGSSWAGTGRF